MTSNRGFSRLVATLRPSWHNDVVSNIQPTQLQPCARCSDFVLVFYAFPHCASCLFRGRACAGVSGVSVRRTAQ